MNPRHRTLTGTALMLAMLPLFIGLLACLPVPIGDPERSRVDPDLSGMWTFADEATRVLILEPHDKRTWLLTGVQFAIPEPGEGDEVDTGYPGLLEYLAEHRPQVTAENVEIYKAWRSRQGKRWFMTWEPRGRVDDDGGFEKEVWFVLRIDKQSRDEFSLRTVDSDFEGFEDVKETRRAYERVIRKNTETDALYSGEPRTLLRIRPEHVDVYDDIVGLIVKSGD